MNIAEISENISELLWEEAEELGRESGFIKRQRKFSGSSYAQMLVSGAIGNPALSYTHMVQYASLAGVQVSAQGISERFTEESADFLKALLERAIQYAITEREAQAVPLLEKFNGVYMRDSSVISLPEVLSKLWPGLGTNKGSPTASVKLQVRLEYKSGKLDGPTLDTGRTHDRRTPYGQEDEPAGSLGLMDLGYFNLDDFQSRQEAGQFIVVRYKNGTVLQSVDGERLDLLEWLSNLSMTRAEIALLVGARHKIPMRLLAVKVPEEVAQQRRYRLKENARKRQVALKPETLALADWVLVLTNVPDTMLTFDEVLVLLYLRWQIELLFKLWKSHFLVDEWRSKNPWRILTELYAKLIAVVICQWIFQLEWWRHPDRSLFKAAQVVQKCAAHLVISLRHQTSLVPLLEVIRECIAGSAHINKRKRKPATFQTLLLARSAFTGGLT